MRVDMGVDDLVSLKGFKIRQCNSDIQQDGHNCGVICIAICVHSEGIRTVQLYYINHHDRKISYKHT